MKREPFHVVLTPSSAWGLIQLVKAIPTHPVFREARSLRRKVNAALLRMMDERETEIAVRLTETEAWIADSVLHPEGAQWCKDLLVQLARVLWEYEYALPMDEQVEEPKAPPITWVPRIDDKDDDQAGVGS